MATCIRTVTGDTSPLQAFLCHSLQYQIFFTTKPFWLTASMTQDKKKTLLMPPGPVHLHMPQSSYFILLFSLHQFQSILLQAVTNYKQSQFSGCNKASQRMVTNIERFLPNHFTVKVTFFQENKM